MMQYVHQNYLTIIDIILSRLPPENISNMFASNLQQIVRTKRNRFTSKREYATYLRNHSDIISNCIKTICRLLPSNGRSSFTHEMILILNNLDKYSIPGARSHLAKIQSNFPIFQETTSNYVTFDAPFLPPVSQEVYTLVLDLDETLVHYKDHGRSGQLLIRPFSRDFLKLMSQ